MRHADSPAYPRGTAPASAAAGLAAICGRLARAELPLLIRTRYLHSPVSLSADRPNPGRRTAHLALWPQRPIAPLPTRYVTVRPGEDLREGEFFIYPLSG